MSAAPRQARGQLMLESLPCRALGKPAPLYHREVVDEHRATAREIVGGSSASRARGLRGNIMMVSWCHPEDADVDLEMPPNPDLPREREDMVRAMTSTRMPPLPRRLTWQGQLRHRYRSSMTPSRAASRSSGESSPLMPASSTSALDATRRSGAVPAMPSSCRLAPLTCVDTGTTRALSVPVATGFPERSAALGVGGKPWGAAGVSLV